jgi:hypothetical protein
MSSVPKESDSSEDPEWDAEEHLACTTLILQRVTSGYMDYRLLLECHALRHPRFNCIRGTAESVFFCQQVCNLATCVRDGLVSEYLL